MSSRPTTDMAASDRTDEAVGTLRAPAWARALPGSAWFVLVLAGFVVWLRASWELPAIFPVEPLPLFWFAVRTLASAGAVGLLAVALAGPTRGPVRGALVAGTACLALAELVRLVLDAAARARALGPAALLPAEPPRPGEATVELAVTVLRLVGPPLIALALVRAAGSEPAERAARTGDRSSLPGVVLVVGLIASLARLAVTIIGVLALDPEAPFTLGAADIAATIVACFAPLAWSTVAAAALAGRRPAAADWLWLVAGSVAIVAAEILESGLAALLFIAGSVEAIPRDVGDLVSRLDALAATLGALGLLGLIAGLAIGPTSASGATAAAAGAGRDGGRGDRIGASGGPA